MRAYSRRRWRVISSNGQPLTFIAFTFMPLFFLPSSLSSFSYTPTNNSILFSTSMLRTWCILSTIEPADKHREFEINDPRIQVWVECEQAERIGWCTPPSAGRGPGRPPGRGARAPSCASPLCASAPPPGARRAARALPPDALPRGSSPRDSPTVRQTRDAVSQIEEYRNTGIQEYRREPLSTISYSSMCARESSRFRYEHMEERVAYLSREADGAHVVHAVEHEAQQLGVVQVSSIHTTACSHLKHEYKWKVCILYSKSEHSRRIIHYQTSKHIPLKQNVSTFFSSGNLVAVSLNNIVEFYDIFIIAIYSWRRFWI